MATPAAYVSYDTEPWLTCTKCEDALMPIESGDHLSAMVATARQHTCEMDEQDGEQAEDPR
jgi:hypothetical protein